MTAPDLGHGFAWPDYLVFFATMVIALSIGVFHGCCAGRRAQRTTSGYLMANRQLGVIPLTLSLLISYVSAVTLIGNGSEMYFYGIHYWFYILSVTLALVLCCLLFVPLFHPLQITSVHQYLDMRYESRAVQLTGTVLQISSLILLNAVFLFGPCIMMESVTGFPVWASMIITGVLATVYTTIGGFKAVIWADVFQTILIVAGLFLIVIKGVLMVGGPAEVWTTYSRSGRFHVDFTLTPFGHLTFWTAALVMSVQWLSFYAVLQPSAQRFCAVETIQAARKVVLLVIPGVWVLGTLACSLGIVAFAYFAKIGCDPYRGGYISNQNQIVPFFVMEIIRWPAIPGLFMACVFAGSLSNLSSFLNAGAAILWNDIFQHKFRSAKESKKAMITKLLAFVNGVLTIAGGFVAANAGGTLVQLTFSFSSTSLTPIFIMFVLGATFPRINWKSTLVGSLVGFVLPMWLAFGATLAGSHTHPLPTDTSNCTYPGNFTETYVEANGMFFESTTTIFDIDLDNNGTSILPETLQSSWLDKMYTISQFWYQPIGITLGIVVGLLASLLPGFHTITKEVDLKLYFPHVRYLLKKYSSYELYEMDEHDVYKPKYGDI